MSSISGAADRSAELAGARTRLRQELAAVIVALDDAEANFEAGELVPLRDVIAATRAQVLNQTINRQCGPVEDYCLALDALIAELTIDIPDAS